MAFIKEGDKKLPFPIIADENRVLAKQLGMIDPDEKDSKGMPLTCRAVSVYILVYMIVYYVNIMSI